MLNTLILGIFTFVQLNCENLFDCVHDSPSLEYTQILAEAEKYL